MEGDILQKVIGWNLNLFGHVCQMKGERLIKTVMFGVMGGQNRRGRNGWMTYRNGVSLYRAAQNREMWSEIARTVVDSGHQWT